MTKDTGFFFLENVHMNQTAINRVRDKLRSYGKDGFPILSQRKREASFSFINERLSPEQRQKATGRTAAVLVPVARIGGEISIIFTKRSETVGSHRGHVSFPGGHLEKDEVRNEYYQMIILKLQYYFQHRQMYKLR